MAQAGFYHQPNSSGDDRAMCFTCSVCLVCWEKTDEPWSEHERHSPTCAFVMGEYTQNVPLSVTLATTPAVDATYRGVPVKVLGTSSVASLFPTANEEGLISVFDVSGKVKRTHSFFVTQFDSAVLDKFTQDFGVVGTWSDSDEGGLGDFDSLSFTLKIFSAVKSSAEKKITALAIVGEKPTKSLPINMESWKKEIRPTIVCGLNIRCHTSKPTSVETLNNQNKETSMIIMDVDPQPETSCLYLVVYDFQYRKELDDVEFVESTSDNTKHDCCDLSKTFGWHEITGFGNETQMETVSNGSEDASFEMKGKEKDFEPYNFIKEQFTMYQTMVSEKTNDIFFPPKQHSGPRALHVESSETDLAQAASVLPFNSSESGKSISDYIAELKNSKSTKKLNYSRAVQCVALPHRYKTRIDLEISDILPITDNRHVLVVLRSDAKNNVLLVYGLDFSQKMVKLKEEPVLVRELAASERPLEVTMLSQLERATSVAENSDDTGPEGTAIIVCADGAVRIIDMSTLQIVSVAKSGSEKFVSAAYCNSKYSF